MDVVALLILLFLCRLNLFLDSLILWGQDREFASL